MGGLVVCGALQYFFLGLQVCGFVFMQVLGLEFVDGGLVVGDGCEFVGWWVLV